MEHLAPDREDPLRRIDGETPNAHDLIARARVIGFLVRTSLFLRTSGASVSPSVPIDESPAASQLRVRNNGRLVPMPAETCQMVPAELRGATQGGRVLPRPASPCPPNCYTHCYTR